MFMKKKFLFVLIFMIPLMLFANSLDEQNLIFQKTFYRGNLQDKIQVMKEASVLDSDVEPIFLASMDFIVNHAEVLSDDSLMIELAKITLENLSKIDNKKATDFLVELFPLYNSEIVKISILNSILSLNINDKAMTSLIVDYGFELLENPKEKIMSLLISVLKEINDSSAFSLLFKYAASSEIPALIKFEAETAISQAADKHKDDMVAIIENGSLEEKNLALRIALNNEKNSDFLRAEIAEKALQVSIIYIGDTENQENLISFQLAAIRELRRVAWTRSADLVIKFFDFARSEYEKGFLSEDDYIEIIYCVEELAISKASSILSDYLAFFNAQTEQGISCSEPVVLAVISSLGNLGNKIAFDNLLYVGYLSYSDEIIEASRVALAGLKF